MAWMALRIDVVKNLAKAVNVRLDAPIGRGRYFNMDFRMIARPVPARKRSAAIKSTKIISVFRGGSGWARNIH